VRLRALAPQLIRGVGRRPQRTSSNEDDGKHRHRDNLLSDQLRSMVSSPLLRRRVTTIEFVCRLGQRARAGTHGVGVPIAISSIRYRVSIRTRRPALEPWRAWVPGPLAREWVCPWNRERPAEPARACLSNGLSTSPARADGQCRRANRVGRRPSRAGLGSASAAGAAQQAAETPPCHYK
jgi:hypothetical protein